jgi:mannose-6-phosphate isomerase-like protein (cupin superfamily)
MDSPIIVDVSSIPEIATSHAQGMKRIVIESSQTDTQITQVATAKLLAGESSGLHQHDTMEEHFFFLEGNGVFTINGIEHEVSPNFFVKIPSKTPHKLKAVTLLSFFYYGIACS